jgi:hypothetical protein
VSEVSVGGVCQRCLSGVSVGGTSLVLSRSLLQPFSLSYSASRPVSGSLAHHPPMTTPLRRLHGPPSTVNRLIN